MRDIRSCILQRAKTLFFASNAPEDTHLFVGKGGGDGGEGDNVGEEHGHVFLGLGRDLNGSDRHNKYTQRGKLG